jgi:hypothetical protein
MNPERRSNPKPAKGLGKKLEDKQGEEYKEAKCLVTSAKKHRFPLRFNGGGIKWVNIGEDLFGCLDKIAICMPNREEKYREMIPDGIYLMQSTTYNNISGHKDKIDSILSSDISSLPITIDLRGWAKIGNGNGRWKFQQLLRKGVDWIYGKDDITKRKEKGK